MDKKILFIKKLSFLIPVLLSIVATSYAVCAQDTRTIRGVVQDSLSGETLPYANVMVLGYRIGAATNFDGRFTLLNVPTDSLTLRVSYLGHEPVELSVQASNDPLFLEIRLRRRAIELDEIVVEAGRNIDVVRGISQVAISPQQVAVLPTIGEVDVFRALQLLPGIAATGDGAGLYIRGGTPDQNLILFDGMTMYHVDHFFGLFSAFNADAIKDVRVYTGGFPAKYGGRVSSVLELSGKDGDNQRIRASAGVNLLSARAVVEGPLGNKASWLIAGRRSYTDIIKTSLYNNLFDFRTGESGPTPGLPGGPGRQIIQAQPDFYFYDFNGKLSYRPTRRDLMSISFYTGVDQLDQSSSGFGASGSGTTVTGQERKHTTDWGNRGASGRWFREWNHHLSSDLLVAASRYFSDEISLRGNLGRQEENIVDNLSARLDFELRATQELTFDFGTWWTENSVSYQFARKADDTVSLAVDRATEGRLAGGYGQGTVTLKDRFDLTAGLRATNYDLTGNVYWEPRASLNYRLTDRFSLKGAWGFYHQFVTRVENEDVLEGSRDFWLLADEELLTVASEHRILGASYEGNHFLFNVEVYEKTFENLTLFSTRYRRDPIADPGEFFLNGDGRARGLEILAQKLTGSLTGWVSYILARVTHWFPEVDDGVRFPANHDQTHTFKAVGTYNIGKWQFTSSWVFGSGRPYTAPMSQYFLTMLDGKVHSYIGVGDKNSLRFPAYHRLDLGVFRRFDTEYITWEIGISIFNVYNRNNLWYRQFDLTAQPITITDVGMLGFTPSIDLRFTLK
jgi:ferric enterobactin receptor